MENNRDFEYNIIETSKKFQNIAFSTSFSIEDQLITYIITKNNLNIKIFTIDTGRLFEKTYKIWQRTIDKYAIKIEPYYYNPIKLEEFIKKNGPNSFYDSKDARLKCCEIRKIEPLNRALDGVDLWISGLRREHSALRNDKQILEYDEARNLTKFYPLLDLTESEIWENIKKYDIPYNDMQENGYKSIGCESCTRAVKNDENPRSGRWWWENDESKECGLHYNNGKLIRAKQNIIDKN